MDIDMNAAREFIAERYAKQGDFDFLPEETFNAMLNRLVEIDSAYIDEIGDSRPYDEDEAFERMQTALLKEHPQQKAYVMRFVDDYLDFMEQYLVTMDMVEWE